MVQVHLGVLGLCVKQKEIHMIYIGIGASVFAVFMLVRKMLKENEREQHALEVFNRNVNR